MQESLLLSANKKFVFLNIRFFRNRYHIEYQWVLFFSFLLPQIPNLHTIPVYPAKRFLFYLFPIQNPPSRVSTPFCFSTVVSVAAIKDIPPGNSKCRFMRNRGKHCFVYHCKELVPLMNTKTKFLQKIWPFVGLYALSVDVLSNQILVQIGIFLIHTQMIQVCSVQKSNVVLYFMLEFMRLANVQKIKRIQFLGARYQQSKIM